MKRGLVTKAVFQMVGIVFAALFFAVLGNIVRKEGLPLATPLIMDARCGSEAATANALSVQEALLDFKNANAVFLDIRPRDEFLRGHIKDAVNLVYSLLEPFPEESVAPLKKKDKVIVYSLDGLDEKANHAADELLEAGVKGAASLSGGFLAWVKAGGPYSGLSSSGERPAELPVTQE